MSFVKPGRALSGGTAPQGAVTSAVGAPCRGPRAPTLQELALLSAYPTKYGNCSGPGMV